MGWALGWTLALSLSALVATPIAVSLARPEDSVGSLAFLTGGREAGGAREYSPPAPGEERMRGAPTLLVRHAAFRRPRWLKPGALRFHSARLGHLKRRSSAPSPIRLRIDALGVDAPVVPMGLSGRNAMQVPADVATVGWYRFGPSPGRPGSAVLIGHVDSYRDGPGVFFRLRELQPGHLVAVRLAGGATRSFRVAARRSYPKDRLPPMLYDRVGRPRLALVTCGGSFHGGTRSYSHNVVVYAVPRP